MITKLRVTCNWCDKYTARYTVVTDDGCTINVTGPTVAAQESVRSMCGLPDDAALPDPAPYVPPPARTWARPVLPPVEAMPRTAADALPGDNPM